VTLSRDDLFDEAEFMRRRVEESYGKADRWVPQSNPASTCGHPCAYFLWAQRARPEDLPSPWEGLPRIFAEGKDSEIKVRRKLEDAGYEVTHEQMRFRDEALDVTGLIDGYIKRPGSLVCARHVPYETKGYSSNNFMHATSFERMLGAPYWRIRLAPAQVLMYAFMAREERPVVCFVPRNKSTGEIAPFFEFVEDWWGVLEQVSDVLTRVNIALKTGTPPEPMLYDPTFCDGCDAAAICPRMQALRGGGNISVNVSADLDLLCLTYSENKSHRSEFEASLRQIKKYLTGAGVYDRTSDEGQMTTLVTKNHRITVTRRGGKSYTEIVPLFDDSAENKEVASDDD